MKKPQNENLKAGAKKKPAGEKAPDKKAASQKPKATPAKPAKKINCQLPGADLLAEGKSVEEVMDALGKEKELSLSVYEERFCQEYVSCGVAVRAALRVWPDLSYSYAATKADRLMKNDEIKNRLKQIEAEYKERYGLTESKILRRLAALATFDRRTLHKEDGSLKQIHELTEEEAAAITEIESVELFDGRGDQKQAIGFVRKVKFADPKGSLELAGKHLNLWKEVGSKDNPLTANVALEVVFGDE